MGNGIQVYEIMTCSDRCSRLGVEQVLDKLCSQYGTLRVGEEGSGVTGRENRGGGREGGKEGGRGGGRKGGRREGGKEERGREREGGRERERGGERKGRGEREKRVRGEEMQRKKRSYNSSHRWCGSVWIIHCHRQGLPLLQPTCGACDEQISTDRTSLVHSGLQAQQGNQ